MLDIETKRRIDSARDILVGKVPDPKSQVEQITIALIYKFMDDMDLESEDLGGERSFFKGEFEKYAWRKIFDPRIGGHEILNLYSEAIVKMNVNPNIPQLFRDIFKNAFLPYRDPETLKAFLKIIHEFNYDNSERLGDAFEYLLSVLGSQGDAGQFRTPRHIIDFMVAILDPKKDDVILDPACGTAGFLISAYKHIVKLNSSNYDPDTDVRTFETKGQNLSELIINSKNYKGDKLTTEERSRLARNIMGYDISPDMVRLSLVNMYLHGLHAPRINEYDTLTSEDNWNEFAEVILANPPFMSPKGGIRPHKRFSIPSNRSEVLFVDYIADHLTPNGRAAVIVPEGIIFQSGKAYKALRKKLVEDCLVGVISLPAGVFQPYSGVKTSILWLDKNLAKRTDKILLVKIEHDGFDLGAQRRPIKLNDLPQLSELIEEYKTSLNQGNKEIAEFKENTLIVEKRKINEVNSYSFKSDNYLEKHDLNTVFEKVELGEVLDYEQPTNYIVESVDYSDSYKIPVLTAGQSFILGYTNEENGIFHEKLPVIIFDDFTTATKYVDFPFKVKSSAMKILKAKEDKANIRFLYYVMQKIQFDSSTHKRYWISQYSHIEIPLPPLSVQEEIVAEIESYQKIIDGARQVVENYKPRIDIDPEWPMVELGDEVYFKVEAGGTPSSTESSYWNGDIYWATLVDLPQSDYISEINSTARKITVGGLKNSSAKIIPPNSIIVSTRATIGRVGINKVPLATNQGFKNVIIRNNIVNPDFIALLIKSLEKRMNVLATGGTFKELSKTNFCKLQIPIPSIEIQNSIVKRIEIEQSIIKANKNLIEIFEQKIKDRIAKVWGN
jgi:type I restriction enzyme M protein